MLPGWLLALEVGGVWVYALRPGLAVAPAPCGDFASAGLSAAMLMFSPLLPAAAADPACAIPSATKGNSAARKRTSCLGNSTRGAEVLGDADTNELSGHAVVAATTTEDMMAWLSGQRKHAASSRHKIWKIRLT